jgi:hypothetical protein
MEITYRIDSSNQDKEFVLACKRRVIQFVYRWVTTIRQPVFEDDVAVEFLEDLASETGVGLHTVERLAGGGVPDAPRNVTVEKVNFAPEIHETVRSRITERSSLKSFLKR